MYKLEKDGFVVRTDKEYKRDQLIRLGFKPVKEPRTREPKMEKESE